jgi:hypothetical protein
MFIWFWTQKEKNIISHYEIAYGSSSSNNSRIKSSNSSGSGNNQITISSPSTLFVLKWIVDYHGLPSIYKEKSQFQFQCYSSDLVLFSTFQSKNVVSESSDDIIIAYSSEFTAKDFGIEQDGTFYFLIQLLHPEDLTILSQTKLDQGTSPSIIYEGNLKPKPTKYDVDAEESFFVSDQAFINQIPTTSKSDISSERVVIIWYQWVPMNNDISTSYCYELKMLDEPTWFNTWTSGTPTNINFKSLGFSNSTGISSPNATTSLVRNSNSLSTDYKTIYVHFVPYSGHTIRSPNDWINNTLTLNTCTFYCNVKSPLLSTDTDTSLISSKTSNIFLSSSDSKNIKGIPCRLYTFVLISDTAVPLYDWTHDVGYNRIQIRTLKYDSNTKNCIIADDSDSSSLPKSSIAYFYFSYKSGKYPYNAMTQTVIPSVEIICCDQIVSSTKITKCTSVSNNNSTSCSSLTTACQNQSESSSNPNPSDDCIRNSIGAYTVEKIASPTVSGYTPLYSSTETEAATGACSKGCLVSFLVQIRNLPHLFPDEHLFLLQVGVYSKACCEPGNPEKMFNYYLSDLVDYDNPIVDDGWNKIVTIFFPSGTTSKYLYFMLQLAHYQNGPFGSEPISVFVLPFGCVS